MVKFSGYNLIIETTSYCNQQCIFCPQYKYKNRNRVMKFKTFRKIIDSLIMLEIPIAYTTFGVMGEPLTDHEIFKKAKYASKLGQVELYTNGKVFTEDNINKANSVFDRIYLSIHGNTKEEYEKYTGNKFGTILKTLEKSKEILGNKLIILNYPDGRLKNFLGEVRIHPWHYWGDEEIKSKINWKLDVCRECEILKCIIIRVDGSIGSCSNDWNIENDILNNKLPRCFNCSHRSIIEENQEKIKEKIELLKKLKKEIES